MSLSASLERQKDVSGLCTTKDVINGSLMKNICQKRNILKAVIKLAPFISFVKFGSFSLSFFFSPLPLRSIKKSDESIVNFLINDQIFCSVAFKDNKLLDILIPFQFCFNQSFIFLIQYSLRGV